MEEGGLELKDWKEAAMPKTGDESISGRGQGACKVPVAMGMSSLEHNEARNGCLRFETGCRSPFELKAGKLVVSRNGGFTRCRAGCALLL